jgi:hypothetical protein
VQRPGPPPASPDSGGSTYALSRAVFVRGLGVVYLIAFLSLAVQIRGLVGDDGILPVGPFLTYAHEALGASAFFRLPTLLWLAPGDASLVSIAWAGAALAVVLVAGRAPRLVLAGLWVLYLSLCVAGQVFLQFQWDALLLEAGLIAIVYAPAGLGPSWRESEPQPIARWLVWGLCFRLMFLSGITKLLSGDPTWRDLTALEYHYWTQPIPNPISWYAATLPDTVQKASVAVMFVQEIAAPLLIFTPTRLPVPRRVACALLASLQIGVAATGNYGFFNLLALLLCAALLDDRAILRLIPAPLRRRARPAVDERVAAALEEDPVHDDEPEDLDEAELEGKGHRGADDAESDAGGASSAGAGPWSRRPRSGGGSKSWPPRSASTAAVTVIATVMIALGSIAFVRETIATTGRPPPAWTGRALAPVAPFRSFNGYGLFRVMTTERPELIIEGSPDGETWTEIPFRFKVGDPSRRPPVVAPYMPRLDWQMWFAALDPPGSSGWLLPLLARIGEGSTPVLRLLPWDPGERTPEYLRITLYRYRFTTPSERRRSGDWWARELSANLTEPLSREDLAAALR